MPASGDRRILFAPRLHCPFPRSQLCYLSSLARSNRFSLHRLGCRNTHHEERHDSADDQTCHNDQPPRNIPFFGGDAEVSVRQQCVVARKDSCGALCRRSPQISTDQLSQSCISGRRTGGTCLADILSPQYDIPDGPNVRKLDSCSLRNSKAWETRLTIRNTGQYSDTSGAYNSAFGCR